MFLDIALLLFQQLNIVMKKKKILRDKGGKGGNISLPKDLVNMCTVLYHQFICQPVSQSVSQSVRQTASQSLFNQSIDQSINQSINQSISQSINLKPSVKCNISVIMGISKFDRVHSSLLISCESNIVH